MNEQAIQDAYNLFVSEGYNGDIDSFKQLISTNDEAMNDAYTIFTENGYADSIEDFKALVLPGKKKESTDLSSSDGGSELSRSDQSEKKTPDIRGPIIKDEPLIAATPSLDQAPQQVPVEALDYMSQLPELEEKKKKEQLAIIEEQRKYRDQRQRVLKSPEFEADILKITPDVIKMDEEDAVKELSKTYGKYGFAFRQTGVGDALEVLAPDGTTKSVDLQTFFSNAKEASDLRDFIESKALPADDHIVIEDDIKRAMKAKTLRNVARQNEDGTVSTVRFQSAEIDGKQVVYPTIFPRNPDRYGSDPMWWIELDGIEAYREALSRGEVFEFKTEEEAQEFSKGSWKDVTTVDAEANDYYAERGYDYQLYKKQSERYEQLRTEIGEIYGLPKREEDATAEQKEKYGDMYVAGILRPDYTKFVDERYQEAESLRDFIHDGGILNASQDFDAQLHKKHKAVIEDAIKLHSSTKQVIQDLEDRSVETFGVPVKDLTKIKLTDRGQVAAANDIITKYNMAAEASRIAAKKYELANTYLDAKVDKKVYAEFLDGWEAVKNGISGGLKRGTAGIELFRLMFGIDDLGDDATVAEAAESIAKKMQDIQNGKVSRAMYNFTKTSSLSEAFSQTNSPIELAATLIGSSISEMLPYGAILIPSMVGAGAGAGAGVGSMAAGVGAAPGAAVGAKWGLHAGVAASSLAVEYTNGIFTAVEEEGYDATNPESLAKALKDQDVWDRGREIGLKRGMPIAAIDAFTNGMAGRVFRAGKLATKGEKILKNVGERIIYDPISEMAGETAAMITAGQELNAVEIVAEGIGGLGSNTPNALVNMYVAAKNNTNRKIAEDFMDIEKIAAENISDEKISNWSNKMEKLGKITAEENQTIQKNIGLRREARDVLGVRDNKDNKTPKPNPVAEARLMELMQAKEELISTPNRRSVFAKKIGDINREIAEIATTGRVPEKKVGLITPVTLGVKARPVKEEAKPVEQKVETQATYDPDEEIILTAATLEEIPERFRDQAVPEADLPEQTDVSGLKIGGETGNTIENGFKVSLKGNQVNDFILANEAKQEQEQDPDAEVDIPPAESEVLSIQPIEPSQEDEVSFREGTIEDAKRDAIILNAITKDELGEDLTEFESEILSGDNQRVVAIRKAKNIKDDAEYFNQEVEDYQAWLKESAPQLQLNANMTTDERRAKLREVAMRQLEQVDLSDVSEDVSTVIDPDPDTPVITIEIKENTELANKVRRIGLSELIGKKINLVMADQLVTNDKYMGGPFFPLQDKLFGKIAWASINKSAASSIVNGAIDADYSVVFNMSPNAVDSNTAIGQELVDMADQAGISDSVYPMIIEALKGKNFGKANETIKKAIEESNNLKELIDNLFLLDTERRAKVIDTILPKEGVDHKEAHMKALKEAGITKESIYNNISEQFVRDLPMGSLTMVLEVTDKSGNKITKETKNEAIVSPEEQDAEGLPRHPNYDYYIRGRAVGILSETTPFWNIIKGVKDVIDQKIAGLISGSGKRVSRRTAEANAYRGAQMSANRVLKTGRVIADTHKSFVKLLSRSFPSIEVVSDQAAFDELAERLTAKKLVTKNQKVYGAVYEGKLYLNPGLDNYNTPIHEFGHVWINAAREVRKDLYDKGLSLIKDSKYVQDIKDSQEYKKVAKAMKQAGATDAEIEAYVLEEALATAIGDKGESFVDAVAQSNFKNWLNTLFKFVRQLTGLSKYTTDQIQDVTLDEFLQGVVVDLLSGEEVFVEAQAAQLSDTLQLMTGRNIKGMTLSDAIYSGRQAGFSDAAIRKVLLDRGYKAKDIDSAMEVVLERTLFGDVIMPKEFGNIDGGAVEGRALFDRVRKKLKAFAKTKKGDKPKTKGELRAKSLDILRKDKAYQSQPESVQESLELALDRTMQTRSNIFAEREMAAIRRRVEQRKLGAKEIQAAKERLRSFIRKSLPRGSVGYSSAVVNNFISRIAKATPSSFLADAEYVLNKVDIIRARMKKKAIRDMVSLVNEAAKTKKKTGGQPRSTGISYETDEFFKEAKRVLRMVLANDIDGLGLLQNEINSNSHVIAQAMAKPEAEITNEERALLNKYAAYANFFELKDMDVEDVAAVHTRMKEIAKQGRAVHRERMAAWGDHIAALGVEVEEQVAKDFPEILNEDGNPMDANEIAGKESEIHALYDQKKYWEWVKAYVSHYTIEKAADAIKSITNSVTHLGTLANKLDKSGSFFTENIYRRLNRAEEKYLRGYQSVQKKLDDLANSIDGITNGMKDIRKKLYGRGKLHLVLSTKNKDGTYNYHMSRDQLLRVYALYKNEGQRAKLYNQGFTLKQMEKVERFLGKELTEFGDKIVDFLSNEYYTEVNDVYRQVNDVNLGYNPNYFPTKTIHSTMVDDNASFVAAFTSDYAPAFKDRVDMKSDVELNHDFSLILELHLDSMERYKAYAVPTKLLQGIMNNDHVKALLKSLKLDSMVNRAIRYAINPLSQHDPLRMDALSKVQAKFTAFSLGLKLMQIPKQASSFFNAFEDYSFRGPGKQTPGLDLLMFGFDAAVLTANLMAELAVVSYEKITNKKTGFVGPVTQAMGMSASFQDRVQKAIEGDLVGLYSGQPSFRDPQTAQDFISKLSRRQQRVVAAPTAIGDIMGVMGYMINYRRNIKNGMSKTKALEAFNDYNATQQSRRPTEKTPMQMSRNYFTRTFTMFSSVLFLQINKCMQASTNLRRQTAEAIRTKDPSKVKIKDIRSLLLNLGIANVLFTGMANIFKLAGYDEDREEALKRMAEAMSGLNLLVKFPGLDVAAQIKLDLEEGNKKAQTGGINPLLQIYNKWRNAVRYDDQDEIYAAVKILAEISLGAQVDPIIGAAKIFTGDFDEDAMYDLLGVSYSYRPNTKDKKKKWKKPE